VRGASHTAAALGWVPGVTGRRRRALRDAAGVPHRRAVALPAARPPPRPPAGAVLPAPPPVSRPGLSRVFRAGTHRRLDDPVGSDGPREALRAAPVADRGGAAAAGDRRPRAERPDRRRRRLPRLPRPDVAAQEPPRPDPGGRPVSRPWA